MELLEDAEAVDEDVDKGIEDDVEDDIDVGVEKTFSWEESSLKEKDDG